MKQIIRRVSALVVGLGLGAAALAGLESVTHISDLNASWPLGSDLASTSDDHIRNIKTALKTDFPNVNAAVNPTPAQFNQLTSNTFTTAVTGNSFIPSSSTVPTNGIYLPAANTLGFSANSTKWGSVNSTGNWVLVAPTSGTAMTVNQFSSTAGISVNGTGPTVSVLDGGAAGARLDITATNSKTTLNFSANTTATPGAIQMTGSDVINISTARNVTVNAPSSGSALALNGVASSNTLSINAPTGASTSFGEFLAGGTNSSDYALSVVSASGGTAFLKVRGDGAIQGGGPVAGALVDMTPDTGTFTGTLVGGTTSPTTTVRFYRIGKQVTVNIPKQTFTSNATSFSMSGVPASLQPATSGDTLYTIGPMQDNSIEVETNFASVNSSGSINFFKGGSAASNWTNIGTKGVGGTGTTGIAFTYSLD